MKAVFIHIPKNAGTSVTKLLRDSNTNCIIKKHGSASFVMDEIGEPEFKSRFSFAFVRNPWDRMVSLFYFKKTRWTRKAKNTAQYPNMLKNAAAKFYLEDDFLGFMQWFLLDLSCDSLSVHNHIPNQEQLAWLTNKDGTDIIVDFVGKVENIAEDIEVIRKVLGIKAELSHQNKTVREPEYRKYYDDETAELIADVFSRDIEAFGYEF